MTAIETHPLTPDRWPDLLTLFGRRGAYGGCWCMWWRQTGAEFTAGRGDTNRAAFEGIVARGEEPGLLAYAGGVPAGWVSVAPRDEYPRVSRSRALRPIDERPAWAIVCFYVGAKHRGAGIGPVLLRAAVAYAQEHGAGLVEAYPVDTGGGRMISADAAYHGLLSWFRKAGFHEVERRAADKPIVRYFVHDAATS